MTQTAIFKEYKCQIHGYAWQDNCSLCIAKEKEFKNDTVSGFWIKNGITEHLQDCRIRRLDKADQHDDKGKPLCWCVRITKDDKGISGEKHESNA